MKIVSDAFEFDFEAAGVNGNLPLLYLWQINDTDGRVIYRYVGKSETGSHRPLKHYARNVRNLLSGKPYRKGNPTGYREAHRQLATAATEGKSVMLRLLCNVPATENIYAAESGAQKIYCTRPYCPHCRQTKSCPTNHSSRSRAKRAPAE